MPRERNGAVKSLLRSLAVLVVLLVGTRAAEPVTVVTGFDATLFPTTQYAHAEIFFRTPPGFAPALALANEIAPGQRLDLLVVARGYAVDAEGRAHVTAELVIHRPDGSVMRPPGSITVANQAKVDPRTLLFPKDIASFNTSRGDPTGDYRFEVVVRDHIGDRTVTKSANVRVTETDAPLPLPADFDVMRFLTDYYQRPRPRLTLPALTAFSETNYARRKAEGHGTLLGFYDQVLADNPWLVPHFTQRLTATKSESERRMLALVLVYAKRSDPKFGGDLPRAARAALTAARKETLPLPSREPTNGGQLDLQWGVFLASGKFEPIANLVGVVQNYLPHRGQLEAYKKLTVKPPALPPEVMKDVLLNSALWSLGSNAHQQKLVRDYLIGIEQAADTTPEVRNALQGALAWRQGTPAPAVPAK